MTQQIKFLEPFVRLVMVAAVISLTIAGGTFSHASGPPHHHNYLTSEDDSDVNHSHVELPGLKCEAPAIIHCGAEILTSSDRHALQFTVPGKILSPGMQLPAEGLFNTADPPPPRYSSIQI